MKTLKRLKQDPRVLDAWDEGEDGYWITLKTGWWSPAMETHAVHEWNIRDLLREFRSIEPCNCADCVDRTGGAA